jgi:nicotinamide-nucleotide amidase
MTARGLRLAIAESLTGGALAAAVVDVPGASKLLLGSIVAYDTALKSALLGVDGDLLVQVGAVDAQVAAQMAAGVRRRLAAAAKVSDAVTVGLACTGVAGPDLQDGKPVGTVFIAVDASGGALVREFLVDGDRAQIRSATVTLAFDLLVEVLAL